MAFTCAFGTTAPVASVTSPWIVALATACAGSLPEEKRRRIAGAIQLASTTRNIVRSLAADPSRGPLFEDFAQCLAGGRKIGEPHFHVFARQDYPIGASAERGPHSLADIVGRSSLVRAPGGHVDIDTGIN